MILSLCFPDSSKSCFACCPPIRPAGYDHINYKSIINKVLLENTSGYNPEERDIRPVTGFSCWALGYLDPEYKQPGCLLHPSQNNGEDLRYRIDYGTKCVRESCHEARIFETLSEEQKHFWLRLARGMDSFEYSSRKINILYKIISWGNKILALIADRETEKNLDRSRFLQLYPFFNCTIPPKGNAYLLTYVANERGCEVLKKRGIEKSFRLFSKKLISGIKERFDRGGGPEYVHKMDMDILFTDFVRISLQIKKSEYSTIEKIMEYTDEQLKLFCRSL